MNTLIHGTGDGRGGASPWASLVIETPRKGSEFEIVNVTVANNPKREAYPVYFQYREKAQVTMRLVDTTISGGYGPLYVGDSVSLKASHCNFHRGRSGAAVHANGRDYSTRCIESGKLGKGKTSRHHKLLKPARGGTGDYHIRGSSPLIDRDTKEDAPAIDLEGRRRSGVTGLRSVCWNAVRKRIPLRASRTTKKYGRVINSVGKSITRIQGGMRP